MITFLSVLLTLLPAYIRTESIAPAPEFVKRIPKISVSCARLPPNFEPQYYNPTDKICYTQGSKSTCPDTMILISDVAATSAYRKQHGWGLEIGKCGCEASLSQYPCGNFPVLYSEKENKCYEMYAQGPCEPDEWFAPALPVDPDNSGKPEGVCKKNPCEEYTNASATSSSPHGHWYEHNGQCYETATRGHCGDPDEVAYFQNNYPLPDCGDPEEIYGSCKQLAQNCTFDELYHERSKKCYARGSQGPCPESMALSYVDKARGENYQKQFGQQIAFGKCDCQLSAPSGSCFFRPYIFSPSAQKCIPAFTQGPCLETEWFIPQNQGTFHANERLASGACAPNDCLDNRPAHANVTVDEEGIFYYGKDGKCFLTGTAADCDDSSSIGIFLEGNSYPSCSYMDKVTLTVPECQIPSGLGAATASGQSLGCSYGFKKRGQECFKPAEF